MEELEGTERLPAEAVIREARDELVAPPRRAGRHQGRNRLLIRRADARIRTADPFITSEVLYQLSYVGTGALV